MLLHGCRFLFNGKRGRLAVKAKADTCEFSSAVRTGFPFLSETSQGLSEFSCKNKQKLDEYKTEALNQ